MTNMILGKKLNFIMVKAISLFLFRTLTHAHYIPPSLSYTHSADAAIEPWLKQLWEKLLTLYPLPTGQKPISDSVLYPSLSSLSITPRVAMDNPILVVYPGPSMHASIQEEPGYFVMYSTHCLNYLTTSLYLLYSGKFSRD